MRHIVNMRLTGTSEVEERREYMRVRDSESNTHCMFSRSNDFVVLSNKAI